MPRFGFFLQDVLWQREREPRPGEAFGCHLQQRTVGGGEELYIAEIYRGSPAALSGLLAVGDVVDRLNGSDPLGENAPPLSSQL